VLIYSTATQIVVSRMTTYGEPFDKYEEQGIKKLNIDAGASSTAVDSLRQDRWSDDDD